MRNSKKIFLALILATSTIQFSCSSDEETASNPPQVVDNTIDPVVLDYKETNQWTDTKNYLVEENRISKGLTPPFVSYRDSDDFKNLQEFSTSDIGVDNYKGFLQLVYSEKNKTFKYTINFKKSGLIVAESHSFKVLNIRTENKDSEILGALILTLEPTNKTDKLEVMFVDKGVIGLVGSQKCLVQISGQQSDLSTKPNEKNFYLSFYTKQSFKIANQKIVIN